MSTPTNRTPITNEDIELALIALSKYASSDGLTPVKKSPGMHTTPQGVLRHELGVSEKRSFTITRKLSMLDMIISTEGSHKVIIKSMMPDIDATSATPPNNVVTVERIRAALAKLRKEANDLRKENEDLHGKVKDLSDENKDLRRRVAMLEQGTGSLNSLLTEIELAS